MVNWVYIDIGGGGGSSPLQRKKKHTGLMVMSRGWVFSQEASQRDYDNSGVWPLALQPQKTEWLQKRVHRKGIWKAHITWALKLKNEARMSKTWAGEATGGKGWKGLMMGEEDLNLQTPQQVRPGGGTTSEDKRQLFFCWSVLSLALLLARDSESLGILPLTTE